MWIKYVTRRLAVQAAQAWNFGWGKAMKKVYGISVESTLVFRDSQKTEYYVDAIQYKKYITGLYKLLKNEQFIQDFHAKARMTLEKILRDTIKKFTINLSKLSNDELLRLYTDFVLPNLEQFYIRMWTVFNINEPLVEVIKKELKKQIKSSTIVDNHLLKLSSPLIPNDILNERIDLLKLAAQKATISDSKYKSLLKKHTERYQHIPMFDFDHEPYSYKYFFKQAQTIKDAGRELIKLKRVFKERQLEIKQIIQQVKPDNKLLELIRFLQENVFLRDYRDMIRQKYNLELRKFYLEVGVRLGLSIEEVAALTNEEITTNLKGRTKFPQDEIIRRAKAYLLIQKGTKIRIYSGDEAISKAGHELNRKSTFQKNELAGIIGSKGKARGRVAIVFTNKDLGKIRRGDVMVTTMTRQDFVPALRKSSALVTDEGSIICHAAIIARELKIPCIVNTKIGTKIFRDGDYVEVDAVQGIIKKLSNLRGAKLSTV